MAAKARFGLALVLIAVGPVLITWMIGYRFQMTPSLPYGVYMALPYDGGKMVGFCPTWPVKHRTFGICPDWHAEMQKPVIGTPGDEIRLSAKGISLDGELLPNTAPLSYDREGHPLAHYPFGTYLVGVNDLWTVSTYNPKSYDSRYYGPIPKGIVREELQPLWTW